MINLIKLLVVALVGVFSLVVWTILILNPLWFREKWLTRYYGSNIAYLNPVIAFNLF